MDNQKQQVLERLQQANNVLVTVSNNPTVDQLSAAIGFTLFLSKLDKHATAVFSGAVPSTIDFLKPDKTIEKTTDSLRDFIISLDKSKADKLRYKVEDQHVKVFITPYRTSITEKDLEFSQGDFNVDAVVAIGVNDQKDLDQAITAHGRILHDATVISVTTGAASTLGTINWANTKASSLCEMIAELSESLKANSLDGQMATAYLTGIVAETARFSNEKTSSVTMTVSAKLMAAGANQQLVATELQKKDQPEAMIDQDQSGPHDGAGEKPADQSSHDGTLEIGHEAVIVEEPLPEPIVDQIHINADGQMALPDEKPADPVPQPNNAPHQDSRRLAMTEPPQLGGVLTASGRPEDESTNIDVLAGGQNEPLLSHDSVFARDTLPAKPAPVELPEPTVELPELPPAPAPEPEPTPAPIPNITAGNGDTIAELEESVGSSHLTEQQPVPADGLDDARNAVLDAISQNPETQPLPPIAALNANPIALDIQQTPPADPAPYVPDLSLPPGLIPQDVPSFDGTATSVENPTAPPPVPPPMMPPLPDADLPDGNTPPATSQDQGNPFGLPPA